MNIRQTILLFAILLSCLFSACGSSSHSEKSGEIIPSQTPAAEPSLFETVYAPYARAEMNTSYPRVLEYLESVGYEYTTTEPSETEYGEIKVQAGEDYVYFAFMERTPGIHTLMMVDYYHEATKSEVLIANYSTDGDHRYDKLQTHVIGESSNDVKSVDEQRTFLFG